MATTLDNQSLTGILVGVIIGLVVGFAVAQLSAASYYDDVSYRYSANEIAESNAVPIKRVGLTDDEINANRLLYGKYGIYYLSDGGRNLKEDSLLNMYAVPAVWWAVRGYPVSPAAETLHGAAPEQVMDRTCGRDSNLPCAVQPR